jgi:hypothetical protein
MRTEATTICRKLSDNLPDFAMEERDKRGFMHFRMSQYLVEIGWQNDSASEFLRLPHSGESVSEETSSCKSDDPISGSAARSC